MATPKSKHHTGKCFTVMVSDAIRHHIGERKSVESKRKIAHEDRDAAVSALRDYNDLNSPEAIAAKGTHSDAIIAIDSLSALLKWHSNQIADLVERADDPALDFMYLPPDPPAPKQSLLNETRPVGRPGLVTPDLPDLAKGDGIDEHLNVSVNELDLRESIKGKLIQNGVKTIGALAMIIDGGGSIENDVKLGDKDAAAVTAAVGKYRKAHRQAMREAEKEKEKAFFNSINGNRS